MVAPSLPLACPNDLMEDFLQHFTSGFHQLFNCCTSLNLTARDSYDLGRPMLLSYIENIKRIGSPDRASFYRARLQALDHHLENLNNLCQANIFAIIDIEFAQTRIELYLLQEELKKKEETCNRELQDLANIQSGIDNELERANLKLRPHKTASLGPVRSLPLPRLFLKLKS